MTSQGRELPPVRSGGGADNMPWKLGPDDLDRAMQIAAHNIGEDIADADTTDPDYQLTREAFRVVVEDALSRRLSPPVRGGEVTDAEVDATMLRLVETVTWSLQDHDGLRAIVRDVLLAASRGTPGAGAPDAGCTCDFDGPTCRVHEWVNGKRGVRGTETTGRADASGETEHERQRRIATTTGEEARDGDVAWVIRSHDSTHDSPLYWKMGGGWTSDVNKAARFALESHAQAAINGNRVSLTGRATAEEHMWTDRPVASRAASGQERADG